MLRLNDLLFYVTMAGLWLVIVWGFYLTVTPVEYCDYKFCIKMEVLKNG